LNSSSAKCSNIIRTILTFRTASEKVDPCIDNVFVIKQTIEKRREFNLETHIAFLDLEKAFDRVSRNQLWKILNRRGIPHHLIDVIRSLYKIPVYELTKEEKFLRKYILTKEYDKGVIYHRPFLTFI
jgi:hypothetical protein